MKGRVAVLGRLSGRMAAALLIDGQLDDLLIDPPEDGPPRPGTIFRGIADRPVKGQGGMFLRLPDGERGFLRQVGGLRPGQSLLVQVTGYPETGKAIPVSTRLLFKSKYAIVTPSAPGINVSRQIRDEERRVGLRDLAEASAEIAPHGIILRSEAADAADNAVAEDIAEMAALAAAICAEAPGEPECLLDGPDAHALAWREWGHPDHVETNAEAFGHSGVLDQLVDLRDPASPLPGGGSLVVEATRALVAVDVNTGADMSPAAGLKANLEAARALPRALRLRGLGGQVVVDLAPLNKRDRVRVESGFKAAFRADPVETALIGWTPLGHLEALRKRERLPLDPSLLHEL